MNLQWGEVSLHPDLRHSHSHSGLDVHRQCFKVTERVAISSTETDVDSQWRRTQVIVCACTLEVTSDTWATSAHEFLLKRRLLQPKHQWSFVCLHLRSYVPLWLNLNVCGHVLCTNVLYMLEYERCTCWWSDKSVLLEVNSQEDGSVCCVFIGTMIHINDLLSLPYSPFILFSSLPFDIPAYFHSQNRKYYVQRESKKYTKTLRKRAL